MSRKTVRFSNGGDKMSLILNRKPRTFDLVCYSHIDGAVSMYGIPVSEIEDLQLAIEGLLDLATKTKEDGQ